MQRIGRIADIFDQNFPAFPVGQSTRFQADEAVHSGEAEGARRLEPLGDAITKLLPPRRIGRRSAVSRRPIAGGKVAEHELETRFLKLIPDFALIEIIGEHEFHGIESGLLRRAEPIHKRNLCKKEGQICCKMGHDYLLRFDKGMIGFDENRQAFSSFSASRPRSMIMFVS